MKIFEILCASLLLLLSPGLAEARGAAPSNDSGARDRELWYRLELAGESAGWVVQREAIRGDEIVSETETHLELRRGSAVATIEMASRFVEGHDGTPRRAWTRQALGAMPIESSYEFRPDAVMVRHLQGSQSEAREERLPVPEGAWSTPDQVRRRTRDELARGAERFSIRAVDPLLGLEPVTTTWVREAAEQEVLSERGAHRTSRWRQTQSFAPQVESRVWVDAEGVAVRSETSLMGLEMILVLTDKAKVFGRPTTAPELLVRSFVRPDRPIERPRRTRRAVYELEIEGGEMPPLPTTGAQTAEEVGAKVRVTVDLDAARTPAAEVDEAPYLRSTTYLPHEGGVIRQLLGDVAGLAEAASDLERAEILRDFVAAYLVDKDLGTVLGTAAEVAATRSGDCTEHSVLLAALLRGAGVASRVVSGLIYVKSFAGEREIFGYHMWTQALVDRRWVDLDATLPEARFDAAHIALATSSLDGEGSPLREMARVLPLMGRLRVRVLETASP